MHTSRAPTPRRPTAPKGSNPKHAAPSPRRAAGRGQVIGVSPKPISGFCQEPRLHPTVYARRSARGRGDIAYPVRTIPRRDEQHSARRRRAEQPGVKISEVVAVHERPGDAVLGREHEASRPAPASPTREFLYHATARAVHERRSHHERARPLRTEHRLLDRRYQLSPNPRNPSPPLPGPPRPLLLVHSRPAWESTRHRSGPPVSTPTCYMRRQV